jgi:phage baseplate assembly protein W
MGAPQYQITPYYPLLITEGVEMYETINQGRPIDAIKFNLKNILLTTPGEKLSDPEFGVGLRHALFELETSDAIVNLKQRIISQIKKYANYFSKLNVIVEISDQYSNAMTIRLEFQYGIKLLNDSLEVTVTK